MYSSIGSITPSTHSSAKAHLSHTLLFLPSGTTWMVILHTCTFDSTLILMLYPLRLNNKGDQSIKTNRPQYYTVVIFACGPVAPSAQFPVVVKHSLAILIHHYKLYSLVRLQQRWYNTGIPLQHALCKSVQHIGSPVLIRESLDYDYRAFNIHPCSVPFYLLAGSSLARTNTLLARSIGFSAAHSDELSLVLPCS